MLSMMRSLVPFSPSAKAILSAMTSQSRLVPDKPKSLTRFLPRLRPAAVSAIAVAFSPKASSIPVIAALKQTILEKSPSFSRNINN